MVHFSNTAVVDDDGEREVKREEPEEGGEDVDVGNKSSEATVKVRSSKITVVDDGEREVKREEPEEGDVDVGNENSEQPSESAVNETSTGGYKRRRRSYAAAAQLMQSSDRNVGRKFGRKSAAQLEVLRTAFDQDPGYPPKKSDLMRDICASTGLNAHSVTIWFKHERANVTKKVKEQEAIVVKVRSPKLTVVDNGEKGVEREEPDEREDVDIGNESSEELPESTVNETPTSGDKKQRRSYAEAAQLMQSSDRNLGRKFGRKSAAQLEVLRTAFDQDSGYPPKNSDLMRDICASTGLNAHSVTIWFKHERANVTKKAKEQEIHTVPPPKMGRMKKKRTCEVERREEEDMVDMDGNKTKKQKMAAQKSPMNPKIFHTVKPAESVSGEESGASITGWFKTKNGNESGVVVDNDATSVEDVGDVEEVQDSEDNVSALVVGDNNNTVEDNDYKRALNALPAFPKVEPPVVLMQDDSENDNFEDTVSPLDTKLIPPGLLIACRDRENSDKRKPKQCALCLEDKPNDRITSVSEAVQVDAQFGSNLATFLKYNDRVLVCDHHLIDCYDLKDVMRPDPVTTVSSRPTKCNICGGERAASVSIVSLKEAANLDVFHGSRVFDALHFSFAVKVCRVHREDLDRYQKAINNQH